MSRRRRPPPERDPQREVPSSSYAIAIVCTDRGAHDPYRICTLDVYSFKTGRNHVALGVMDGARPVTNTLYPAGDGTWIPDDGRHEDEVKAIRQSPAGHQRYELYRFPCHRCGRDVPIRGERLEQIAGKLRADAVSRLDISALPAILGK